MAKSSKSITKPLIDTAIAAAMAKQGVPQMKTEQKAAAAQREAAEERMKAEQAERNASSAQLNAARKQEKNAEEIEELEHDEKELKYNTSTTSSSKMLLALILAVIYDIADGVLTFTGVSEIPEFIVNVVFQIILKGLMGSYFSKATWLEMIPFVDVLPIYSLSVFFAYKRFKEDTETDDKKVRQIKDKRKEREQFKINLKMAAGSKTGKIVILLIFAVLLVAGFMFMASDRGAKFVGDAIRWMKEYFTEGKYKLTINKFTAIIKGWIDGIMNIFSKRIEAAKTGEIFAGEVENAKKLGLELKINRIDYPFTTSSKKVYISGSLSGRGLDPKICRIIDPELGCELSNKILLSCFTSKNEKGEVSVPELTFLKLENTLWPFACQFDLKRETERTNDDKAIYIPSDEEITKKSVERLVYVAADFDFITAAYTKKQFVTESKFMELATKGYDYEKFTPKWTPGPVSVTFLESFVNTEPLIADNGMASMVGIRIENTGTGEIDHIEKIMLLVPKGIKISACNAEAKVEENKIKLSYEDESNFLKDYRNRNIKPGKTLTITCDMMPTAGVLDANSEITTDYFEAVVVYKYKTKEIQKIEIVKSEIIIKIDDDSTICTAPKCECTKTTLIIEKGTTCGGKKESEVDAECKKKTAEECGKSENLCILINNACRAKTIRVS